MKKIVFAIAIIAAAGACLVPVNAQTSDIEAYVNAGTEEMTVTAYKNPEAGVKIKCRLNVTWDGSECYVVGRDGRRFDHPIRARYSTTYSGYPYRVDIGNQTWYFAL